MDEILRDGGVARWLALFLPAPGLVFLLTPLSLAYGAAAAWLAGWLRMRRRVRAPYTRKVFHFAIFTAAGVIHLGWGLPGVVVFGSVITILVLHAVWRGDGHAFYEAMARPTDAPRRTLFIIVPLVTTALGGLVSNFFFMGFAYVGYLVGGWGDAVGEPVGTRWGAHRYRVPSLAGVEATRSLEGSAAVLLAGSLAAFLGLWAGGLPAATAGAVGLACGAGGALVEAISSHGLDNFFVQITGAGIAYWILG